MSTSGLNWSGGCRETTELYLPGDGLVTTTNGGCANCVLSQWRGSPHSIVPIFVPTPCIEALFRVASVLNSGAVSHWKLTMISIGAQRLCPVLTH